MAKGAWRPPPQSVDIVVNADTTHPRLAEAIAELATVATAIDEGVGGKTAIEALLCVYLNMALQQTGIAEVRDCLQRAIAGLPALERGRQIFDRPTQGEA